MLKVQHIRDLIKVVDQSSVQEFTYESESEKIRIKKGDVVLETAAVDGPVTTTIPQPAQEDHRAAVEARLTAGDDARANHAREEQHADPVTHITSPMVGTYYSASQPGAAPYVRVGDTVHKDTVVCIVEAMKLFNEIEAEVDGEIVEVMVKDGQLVEYGQPLFAVKKK
ncbi:acetyl-CoA carboxylase biotin carboxyl carrier protein [Brevibacillus humidisoli]|uniref:acetyl-CoA carboxylase biotin carboxyl carrier protein n=1 Tax=Brevibacillus humidisoli TaxID=2895522 RepID=UPI001E4DAFF5|nr:acetyl-CoA carboxylase biotin carboxyl carrier protein [Brevibacillus humidisoli]UFJ41108.1 acetyl-CoA carboxylase biotin carboxyl carrier protein [Brevibacillus humidisoli]